MSEFLLLLILFVAAAAVGALMAKRDEIHTARTETDSVVGRPAPAPRHKGIDSDNVPEEGSVVVQLSDLAQSAGARKERDALRIGDPVWLEDCSADGSGIARIKVYSGGFLVGQLLLDQAVLCSRLISHSLVESTLVEKSEKDDFQVRVYYRQPARDPAYKLTFAMPGRTAMFIQN